jgi:uncharacterized protein YjiS (DUF1127 family)
MDSSTIEARALPVAAQGAAGPWQVLVKAVKRVVAGIRSKRRTRRGIAELRALDDRLLADIGLSRDQIEYASPPKGCNDRICQ